MGKQLLWKVTWGGQTQNNLARYLSQMIALCCTHIERRTGWPGRTDGSHKGSRNKQSFWAGSIIQNGRLAASIHGQDGVGIIKEQVEPFVSQEIALFNDTRSNGIEPLSYRRRGA